MPSYPIYIRNEDVGKWLAIENKAEWIHNQLNGTQSAPSNKISTFQALKQQFGTPYQPGSVSAMEEPHYEPTQE